MAQHQSISPRKIGAIIFARYDSRRLYGKLLMDIAGRPLLDHVLTRTRRIHPGIDIVLATTGRQIDSPLLAWAQTQNLPVHCGHLKNVTARAVTCAEAFGFSGFVRVCADRPFIDPTINAVLLKTFKARELDLATNSLIKTFPTGAMAEVVRVSALRKVMRKTRELNDLEHVTKYIYQNPGGFRVENLGVKDSSLAELSLAVDTKEDLDRTRWIFENLSNPAEAAFTEIVKLTRIWNHANKADSNQPMQRNRKLSIE